MADFPFINKYGKITYSDPADAFVRSRTYIILKSTTDVLCLYHTEDDLYTLPTSNDLTVNGQHTNEWTTVSYLTENRHPIKETQTYFVYSVEKGELPDKSFQWCKIDDILLNKIAFDCTKLVGIKNLIVRSQE